MTLNRTSRSQDFDIKYVEYGARYDVGHNGGQTGNHHGLSIGTMTLDYLEPS